MDDSALIAVIAVASAAFGSLLAIAIVRPPKRGAKVLRVQRDSVLAALTHFANSYGTAGLLTDGAGHVIHASPTSEALGLIKRNVVVPEIMREAIEHTSRTGEGATAELSLDNGLSPEPMTAQIHSIPVDTDLVLILVDDTSESHRLEEMRRDFVANISHELKTPIGAIILLAEALRDGIDDPTTATQFAKNVHKESLRLARIVSDIIQLSRVQAREILREAQALSLESVIAEAVDQTSVAAQNRGVDVVSKISDKVTVLGDGGLLTIAIKNLIENAIQFSEDRGVVTISVKTMKRFVNISVSDTGVGIGPEDLARVFERFYRVDVSRSRKTGGTGLGLSIVKHIVLAHRGEIAVQSQIGVGSTFTITLPKFTSTKKRARA